MADPSHGWLPGADAGAVGLFEVELAARVLNEQPRQTCIDYLTVSPDSVVSVEAKYTEPGFGRCFCEGRSFGQCAARIQERPYWEVARSELGLERDILVGTCPLSLAYQLVRNVAAAIAVANGRRAWFVLLYDERNPYFSGAGAWPGWARILAGLGGGSHVGIAVMSWQQLVRRAPIPEDVAKWAHEKHGIQGWDVA